MSSRDGIPAACLIAVLSLMEAGCATDPAPEVDKNFGSSVRYTIALQTAEPGSPSPRLDAAKATAAFREYQKDVAKPKKVEAPLTINIGSGSR